MKKSWGKWYLLRKNNQECPMRTLLSTCLLCLSITCHAQEMYTETLYPEWQQQLRMDRILKQDKTDLQDLVDLRKRPDGNCPRFGWSDSDDLVG